MLFQKKNYLDWEQYNRISNDIEHWRFISDKFEHHLRSIR